MIRPPCAAWPRSSHARRHRLRCLRRLPQRSVAFSRSKAPGCSRYDRDRTATVVGGWSSSGEPPRIGLMIALGGHNAVTRVFETGRPGTRIAYAAYDSDPATAQGREAGGRAAIGAPISVASRLWGAVVLVARSEETWTPIPRSVWSPSPNWSQRQLRTRRRAGASPSRGRASGPAARGDASCRRSTAGGAIRGRRRGGWAAASGGQCIRGQFRRRRCCDRRRAMGCNRVRSRRATPGVSADRR